MRAIVLILALALLTGCTAGPSAVSSSAGQPEVLALSAGDGRGSLSYGEEAAPLPAEAEALLEWYFSTWYQSLATLSEADFAPGFCDSTQAERAAASHRLQVGIRTMQPLDYTLTDWSYALTVDSVEQSADGALSVRLEEDSTESFAALPGVESERYDRMHSFTLEQTAEGWRIRRHSLFDTLESDLWYQWMGEREAAGLTGSPGFGSRGDTASAYIEAVPEFLDEYAAALTQRLAEADAEPEPVTAAYAYDREAAVAYADAYAGSRNPEWPDYTRSGGNCQNYASQVLLAGGVPMDPYGGAVWKWYGDSVSNTAGSYGRSSSWSGVKQFIEYARSNTGYGLAAVVDAPYQSGEAGDLLHMGSDGDMRHTVVIVEAIAGEDGATVDYLVDSNTGNLRHYPASLYGYPDQLLVHIAGWNA